MAINQPLLEPFEKSRPIVQVQQRPISTQTKQTDQESKENSDWSKKKDVHTKRRAESNVTGISRTPTGLSSFERIAIALARLRCIFSDFVVSSSKHKSTPRRHALLTGHATDCFSRSFKPAWASERERRTSITHHKRCGCSSNRPGLANAKEGACEDSHIVGPALLANTKEGACEDSHIVGPASFPYNRNTQLIFLTLLQGGSVQVEG